MSRTGQVVGRTAVAVGAVLVALALGPPVAGASVTVSQSGGVGGTTTLSGDAAGNDIQVKWVGGTNVWSPVGFDGEPVIAGAGCQQDGNAAVCPDSDLFIGNLGEGNDALAFSSYPADASVVYTRATIDGGPGDDTIEGQSQPGGSYPNHDVFYGGPGGDRLYGNDGDDELHGGDGDDWAIDGGPGQDAILGEAGNDGGLWGGDGNDVIDAGPGDDHRDSYGSLLNFASDPRHGYPGGPEPGADTYIGGSGIDLLEWSGAVHVSLDGAANDGDGTDNVTGDIEQIGGSGANDVLTGDAGSQTIAGYDGDDTIDPGPGPDVVYGDGASCSMGPWGAGCSAGNDTINTRDGFIDQVNCGMGVDRLIADYNDVVAGDWGTCETIERPVAPTRDTTAPAIRLPDRRLTLDKRGYVRVRVTCPAAEPAGCKGTVTLRTARRVKVSRKARSAILRLGSKTYTARAGKTVTVKVKVSAKGRTVVRRARRLKARLSVSARDQANNSATTTRTLTLSRR